MLSLAQFAKNYELFKNLFSSSPEAYDYDKVIAFFKLWEERDLKEFMKRGSFAFGIKGLMTNIALAKGLPTNSALLAKDVYMHMMKDQFYCSMLYMLGNDKDWLKSVTTMSAQSREALEQIKTEKTPPTVLAMHYGPYRAVPPFVSLFERPFLIPHTDNDFSAIFKKEGVIPEAIDLCMVDDKFPQRMIQNFNEDKGLFLLGDYSVSPRKSKQTASLYETQIHAPSGAIRVAQRFGSSLFVLRIKSQAPCNFDVKIDKLIDGAQWETKSREQVTSVNEQCFKWFAEVIESDPAPWQGWHRFKDIVVQEE